ncbi:hypothetical protein AcW1_002443 [Taiwanofungus camphoratus]|nr:hypothetical protein AcW1_002443 [Antrodia cinnamomea]
MDSVTTSIVYPDPLESYSANSAPQPFFVLVSFCGDISSDILRGEIPLQISISLPQEYAHFTSPILHALPAWLLSDTATNVALRDTPDQSISFLPLPSTFSPSDWCSWAAISTKIEMWLLNEIVNTRCADWTWGCDAFWIVFISAHPDFPAGEWPKWNAKIALEGSFIERWMQQDCQGLAECNGKISYDHLLAELWSEFQQLVSLYFPGPLICIDT